MLKKFIVLIIEVVLIAILAWGLAVLYTSARTEEFTEAWVVCQPKDYVNARARPTTHSEHIGRFETGDQIMTDGVVKNGFLHIVHAKLEEDEAWIHAGYVVFDPPVWSDCTATVISNGRLAARKSATGKVRKWLNNGDTVRVHWITSEWCVTNKGFIATEFLEIGGE